MESYEDYVETLPQSDILEVRVISKDELCQEFGVSTEWGRTTQEINELCRALARQDERDIYLISKLTDLLH